MDETRSRLLKTILEVDTVLRIPLVGFEKWLHGAAILIRIDGEEHHVVVLGELASSPARTADAERGTDRTRWPRNPSPRLCRAGMPSFSGSPFKRGQRVVHRVGDADVRIELAAVAQAAWHRASRRDRALRARDRPARFRCPFSLRYCSAMSARSFARTRRCCRARRTRRRSGGPLRLLCRISRATCPLRGPILAGIRFEALRRECDGFVHLCRGCRWRAPAAAAHGRSHGRSLRAAALSDAGSSGASFLQAADDLFELSRVLQGAFAIYLCRRSPAECARRVRALAADRGSFRASFFAPDENAALVVGFHRRFDQGCSISSLLRRIGILLQMLFEDARELERSCCRLRRAPSRVPSARPQTVALLGGQTQGSEQARKATTQ